jgi:hypothetical protein
VVVGAGGGARVVGGAVLGGVLGGGEVTGGGASPAAKVTGMKMSWVRSPPRTWSLRVTMAHWICRQSKPSAITGATSRLTLKLPPAP